MNDSSHEYPVVRLTSKDLSQLAELEAACFPDPWSLQQMQSGYARDCCMLLGIREANALIGYISAVIVPPEMEILNVAVLPDYRERGLGRKLVDAALNHGMTSGSRICFLEVDEGNIPAVHLYQSLGFRQSGRRKGYYSYPSGHRDAIVMHRDITQRPDTGGSQ